MSYRVVMKRQFIVGVIGGILGIATAAYVIFTSASSDMTLSGVQAALFSSLGLMGAAIANSDDPVCRVDAALIRGLDPAVGPACRNIVP